VGSNCLPGMVIAAFLERSTLKQASINAAAAEIEVIF
jgi:hypothetical protein